MMNHNPDVDESGGRHQQMTRSEREDLLKVCRMLAKVAKADAAARSAKLKADFAAQLAAEYSYDNDEVWKEAHAVVRGAAEQAQEIVARRCEELGIPRWAAPSLGLHWYRRGENAVKERRTELTRVAHSRIDEVEKKAKLEIDRASTETQTKLLAASLESAEAQAFLAAMPTAAQLMAPISLTEVRKQLDLPPADDPEVSESGL
jgi:hypothetical protein